MAVTELKNKISDGWIELRLGSLPIDWIKGINAIKTDESTGSYLIPSAAVFPDKMKLEKGTPITLKSKKDYLKKINQGDILFNSGGEGTLGRSAFFSLDDQAYFGDSFVLTLRSKSLDSKMLFYMFNLSKTQKLIQKYTNGSTGITSIKESDIKKFKVVFPENPKEQQKIAEVLTTVDEAIEKTDAIIEKNKRIKQGLMQDLFRYGIDEHGNIRSEKTHKFKTVKIGNEEMRIPEEWELGPLSNFINNLEQGWSPDCEVNPAVEGEWGVLKTTAVTWSGFDYHENKKLPDFLIPRPRLVIKENDILMTRGGPNSRVGVVAYVSEARTKLMISDKIYRLHMNNSVDQFYCSLLLSSEPFQNELSRFKTGMAESQTNISQKIVSEIIVSFPDKMEQLRITSILAPVLESIKNEFKYKEKLIKIKVGLMEDLLTGAVRVNGLITN